MNGLLRTLCAVVITTLTLAPAKDAAAQPSNERVLVVDVSKGRGSDARLIKGLGEHLMRAGLLLTEGILSATERTCDGPECFEQLATREGAGLVLTAKIQDSTPGSFFITMALFDAERRAPLQETALCDQCTQEQLGIRIGDVADKLIRQCREARQRPPHAEPPVSVALVPIPAVHLEVSSSPGLSNGGSVSRDNAGLFAGLSKRRKILAGVLGGLAGATLITSIALSATHRQYTSLPCNAPDGQGCRLDNLPLFATGYAVTGALAVGVGITLFWPEKSNKPQLYAEVR